jgi:hypothetical protein
MQTSFTPQLISQSLVRPRRFRFLRERLWFAALLAFLPRFTHAEGDASQTVPQLDIAPVWSVHYIGQPVLVTRSGYQYVLYYDQDRHVAIAQRKLDSRHWNFYTFPEVQGWASSAHCNLSLAIDGAGHIHASAYNRGFTKTRAGAIYYRSATPHNISRWNNPPIPEGRGYHYQTFVQSWNNGLMCKFRDGSAVKGENLWTVYDQTTGNWGACKVFTAGMETNEYAYNNMVLGPDGYVHAAYVWSDAKSPDSFHNLCHVRSKNLQNWETIDGKQLSTPLKSDTEGPIVCPVPRNSGMLNNPGIGFTSSKKPVITYQRFDTDGNTQFYNAQFVSGTWQSVAATAWKYRWRFVASGPGEIGVSPVQPIGEGKLLQKFHHIKYGQGAIVLDENTLMPLGSTYEYTLVPSSNLKLKRTLRASSEMPGFEAAKASDSDLKTRWLPKEEDHQPWFELEFDQPISFSHFSMRQLRLDILAFELDYWDGAGWQRAYQSTVMQTTFLNETWMYTINPVTTQKVRLRITSVNPNRTPFHKANEILQASIFEFDVHVKQSNPRFPKNLLDRTKPWPAALEKPDSRFKERPMSVDWIEDSGSSGENGMQYYLRWEHGPSNRDSEVSKPWPEPTMLRLYQFNKQNALMAASEFNQLLKAMSPPISR